MGCVNSSEGNKKHSDYNAGSLRHIHEGVGHSRYHEEAMKIIAEKQKKKKPMSEEDLRLLLD